MSWCACCHVFVSLKDRLILGSNCTYLFIGFPSERGGDDWSRYDYDYFLSELAAAEGIHLGKDKDSQLEVMEVYLVV